MLMKKVTKKFAVQPVNKYRLLFSSAGKKCLCGILFILSFLGNPAAATGDEGIESVYSSRLTGTVATANSQPLFVNNTATHTFSIQPADKVRNIITFSVIEETPLFIPANFTASVQVRIDYGTSSSSFNQYTQTFTVDYNKNEGAKYNAKNYFSFEGAPYVKITLLSITAPVVGSLDTREVLSLQNEMRITRYLDLGNNILPLTFTSTGSVPDALFVNWSWPANAGNNGTQLEWTWLEDETAATYYVNGVLNYDLLFRNNATRVDLPLSKSSFNIPLYYDGIGKVYYRVRAVSFKNTGNRIDGPWSSVLSYSFNGHDNNLNWQVRTSFAEEGKMKTVMEYYDGSLRSRQTVTKENVNNTIVSAETFYDEQGRPAIQVLPTPSLNTVITFTKGLNLFSRPSPTEADQTMNDDPARFFDLQPMASTSSITPSMLTSTGASRYYSIANPEHATGINKNIPDAEGYPYTVTRYTPDGTGRIMSQSGVGTAMKMGSGRETKYYYGSPAQEELDGLFGTEVGNYTHYFKNMVKDANGQMSVSYTDMHGRTIATALAGDAPSNLMALNINNATHYPNQAGTTITRNLLSNNSNIIKGNGIESINTLLVPATTIYNFQYQLNPEILQLSSCSSTPICYDCMYNLVISVTDESGDMPPIVKKFNNISLSPDDNCNTAIPAFQNDTTGAVSNNIQFNLTLPPGSYSVRKTLTVSESSLQTYKDLYLTKALCKTEQQIIDSVYSVMLSLSGCGTNTPPPTCQSCLTALGDSVSFRATYLTSIGLNPAVTASYTIENEIRAAYAAEYQNCNRLCSNVSQLLALKRQLMLSDMMPDSGQYARRVSTGTTMYNKYDIFSTVNTSTQPFYKKPWNTNQQLNYYYNAFNLRDETIHPAGAADPYALLNSTTADQYSEMFTYSWANAMLPHHPEYNRLTFAEANLTNSYNWISTFSSISTYGQANANGYIITAGNTTATPYNDPFFSIAPTSTYRDSMVTWVTSNYKQGLSMWQIARGDVKCKTIMDQNAQWSCYNNGGVKVPPFADVTTTADQDQMWKVFKGLYAAERDRKVNDYIVAMQPLADDATLISQGYKLRFSTITQEGTQNGWTWFPSPGSNPNLPPTIPQDSVNQGYNGRCNGYINQWKQALLQCAAIANHAQKDQILNQITAGMVTVCIKGSNAANPYGSSTVAPTTPNDGSPRSFEEVINIVLAQYSISRDYFCNPYTIEFPKPYGKGPKLTKDVITLIDTCTCNRMTQLKAEASSAGYNPASFTSFNQYLLNKYSDTLTLALYNSFGKCDSLVRTTSTTECYISSYYSIPYTCGTTPPLCWVDRSAVPAGAVIKDGPIAGGGDDRKASADSLIKHTEPSADRIPPPGGTCYVQCPVYTCNTIYTTTVTVYPLVVPQPLPEFLKCGFVANNRCLSCADLSALTGEFKTQFSSPYNAGPIFTGTNLTDDEINKNNLYSRFINYRTGFSYNWADYAKAAAMATPACNLANYASNSGATQNVICGTTKLLTDTGGVFVNNPPCQRIYNMAAALGQTIYQQRVEYLLANFEALYRAKCMAARNIEQFTVNYSNKEYHYTLYYYDMAGSLVKTVPPKGVRPDFSSTYTNQVKADRANGVFNPRPHQFVTQYRYNSLGAVVAQNTPDANTSNFWYDRLGRLVVSRNAQQAIDGKYSYTLYDNLGRITEVGQKPQGTAMTQTISQDNTALNNWILNTGGIREQITYTVYDLPYGPGLSPLLQQQNLRNRVSYTATKNLATDAMQYSASFFTYDIHGNVDTLLQDYKGVAEMDGTNNRFKMLTYKYDLVSGKVNMVSYQPDKPDAFYHRYNYDAENRLTSAETSRDKLVWERDAAYNYYKYGPLARTELGQLRVQGTDYAYTVQGWLKGVNGTTVSDGTYDIGQDGLAAGTNSVVARDVYGFGLHYFDDGATETDYKPIDNTILFARPNNGAFKSLYNGSIAAMSVNNAGLLKGPAASTNALPLFYNYRYDQLNRIVSMNAYKGLSAANQWVPISITDYAEAVSYDPNGNILTYNRKGAPTANKPLEMDDLVYNYYSTNNQLKQVTDNIIAGNYTEDIDHQSNASNYTYDATGNLKTDVAEDITAVNWTVYGKISSIVKGGNTISYTYDAAGNRITKTANGKTTIYVRDASGNVMSVYEKPAAGAIVQLENHIYGSSRAGMVTQLTVATQTVTLAAGYGSAVISVFTRNEKIYELSNHLQNVLVTISDKKIGVDANSDGIIDYYTTDVKSVQDFYPFGFKMPGRQWSNGSYRFGFNGREEDDEVKGDGNSLDYKNRIYDPRVGRFLSVDPIADEYPSLTPYQFASNQPIESIDLDGLERLDYRLTFNEGQAQLDLQSTGESKEYIPGVFGSKVFSRTVDIPKHYRVEYNGQHYLFASGGQNSDYVKNMPPAASAYGEYNEAVYSVAELWAFQSDPVSFLKTHKSSEEVTGEWDDALAKAEMIADLAEALSSSGRGGRGKTPRIRIPKPRTSSIKPTMQQKVAATPSITVKQKAVVQQKAITHYQPTGSLQGKKVGHTFSKHGRHNTKQLTLEAVNGKKQVGQFLDEAAAEKIIGDNLGNLKNGAINVPIPAGVGRVIMPNGSFKPATQMRIVPSGSGVSTAYPIL